MKHKIEYLLCTSRGHSISLKRAAEVMDTSEADTERIVTWASQNSLIKYDFRRARVKVLSINGRQWATAMTSLKTVPIYKASQREAIIYLLCYSEFDQMSLFHFESFLEVSKGTAISDVKRLRNQLVDVAIRLDYTRQSGFKLCGDETSIRVMAQHAVSRLLSTKSGQFALFEWLWNEHDPVFSKVHDLIGTSITGINMTTVPERLDEIVFLIGGSQQRMGRVRLPESDLIWIRSLKAYRAGYLISKKLAGNVTSQALEAESAYVAGELLAVSDGNLEDAAFDGFVDDAAGIIRNMEEYMGVEFADYHELLFNVFNHLVPAFFRIKMHFRIANSVVDNVKHEYQDIYKLTQRSLQKFSDKLALDLPDAEVALFTVLFVGAIYSNKQKKQYKIPRAIIVCPNGTSSSLMLQSELKQIFTAIDFEKTGTVRELENIGLDRFDLIFTTVNLDITGFEKKKIFVVRPFMSQLEKSQLIYQVQREVLLPGLSVPSGEDLVKAIRPYVSLRPGVKEEDLYKVINRKFSTIEEDDRPMLTDLITADTVQVTDKKIAWKEAIALAAQPLLDQKLIEPRYVDAMIGKVEEYGPFIHIGRGVAMPHARPEDGVNGIGMAVLKVKEPVLLLDQPEHAVSIFICLAAIDNTTHLKALSSLADILSDDATLDQLLASDSEQEILDIFKKGVN